MTQTRNSSIIIDTKLVPNLPCPTSDLLTAAWARLLMLPIHWVRYSKNSALLTNLYFPLPAAACSMELVSQFQVETTCLIHLCTGRHHLRVLGIVQHCQTLSKNTYMSCMEQKSLLSTFPFNQQESDPQHQSDDKVENNVPQPFRNPLNLCNKRMQMMGTTSPW